MTIGQIAKIARARLGFPEEEKLDAYEEITVSRQDALEDAQTLGDAEIGTVVTSVGSNEAQEAVISLSFRRCMRRERGTSLPPR